MKLFPSGSFAALSLASLLAAFSAIAQTATTPAPPSSSGQEQSTPQPVQHPGKVLFERSLDGNGNTVSTTGAVAKLHAQPAEAAKIEDPVRQSIAITDLNLDVRLQTTAQQLASRAFVTVRNIGKAPITHIPLQISSSLNWESVRLAGRDINFTAATINSDSDHTGQLHEAVISLAQQLDPGATLQLDVTYSGRITTTARRLLSIGTPEDSALHSDWDEISPEFTGLRGFGNVVWYPVVSTPVMIGDGARLFHEIGRQKILSSGTAFRLRLTVEFPHGQPPTVAVVNGNQLRLNVSDSKTASPDLPGIASGDTGPSTLSFESPSLFISTAAAHPGTHVIAYPGPEDEVPVKSWLTAATAVSPMIERWLGPDARTQLTLLDLPDPDDKPWESGPLLAIPLRDGPPEQLDSVLAHALTHAWMAPNPYWLNEGTANFMGTLWDDHEHHRDKALAMLEAERPALALAEPPSPGEASGQPLTHASSPIYFSTKAAYVLWMLRDLVGDDALSAALRAFNAAETTGAPSAELPSFQALLKTTAPGKDLKWLFADWIDADHGLPDLTIDKVFPNAVQSGNWLVSVTISNSGYAAAEVPVTVHSASNTTTEQVFVPARGTVTPRLLVQGKPTEVQLNDGTVPETQASVHEMTLDQPAQDASTAPQ